MSEIIPLYLCNMEAECNISPSFGDECIHTTSLLNAKNESSVKLFYDFTDRFDIYTDDDGRIVCVEKGEDK